ncbi:lysosome-associated membrane glycoprotein 1 [Spea bombifrons]|uniref:lysosome-associated membrane glycoprotein 1 n=1 Tax=Spea bombifrons TaxID=233779 RepID=UPI0023491E5D|nr:lysosome-associated membrane glycoprotein 1 [Spea bombifrons]
MKKVQADGERRLGECGRAAVLLLVLGCFHSASSVPFEVKEGNNTCIIADIFINFTVEYTALGKQEKAAFDLPSNAEVDSRSTCGTENGTAPVLAISFRNHSLTINFTKTASSYQVAEIVFAYNLSDKNIFPNATENVTKEVSSNNSAISAEMNTFYRCFHPHLITMGSVNATFHDVKIEAFLKQNTYSKKDTLCSEDVVPTSPPTTAAPTSAPFVPTPPPVGDYTVNGTSGPCILAKMGLQLNVTYTKQDDKDALYVFNIDRNNFNVSGSCGNTSAIILLSSDAVQLSLQFALNSSAGKYYLSGVAANTTLPADSKVPKLGVANNSLTYFQTTARKSYRCNAKQALEITSKFTLNTYNVQIQPFDVSGNAFGPAVECALDENSMLVPIVVGAALAGLVLIVLIAYLVGRKRSHAGYQTI